MSNCGKTLQCVRTWPKIILYGDSITQFSFSADGCWGSLLAEHTQRKCDVVNRGFSGYNTRWCKVMLPAVLDEASAEDVAAMTIFLGANDSNDERNVKQHVPLQEYTNNMRSIVEYVMSIGIRKEKVILITPPAFNEVAWGEECKLKGRELTKDHKTTGLYAKACSDLAKELGTNVVDLYTEMMKAEDFTPYLNDGLHLSASGSQLLFSLLKPVVDHLTSDLPSIIFPYWDDVDPNNPEKSLLEK